MNIKYLINTSVAFSIMIVALLFFWDYMYPESFVNGEYGEALVLSFLAVIVCTTYEGKETWKENVLGGIIGIGLGWGIFFSLLF